MGAFVFFITVIQNKHWKQNWHYSTVMLIHCQHVNVSLFCCHIAVLIWNIALFSHMTT